MTLLTDGRLSTKNAWEEKLCFLWVDSVLLKHYIECPNIYSSYSKSNKLSEIKMNIRLRVYVLENYNSDTPIKQVVQKWYVYEVQEDIKGNTFTDIGFIWNAGDGFFLVG